VEVAAGALGSCLSGLMSIWRGSVVCRGGVGAAAAVFISRKVFGTAVTFGGQGDGGTLLKRSVGVDGFDWETFEAVEGGVGGGVAPLVVGFLWEYGAGRGRVRNEKSGKVRLVGPESFTGGWSSSLSLVGSGGGLSAFLLAFQIGYPLVAISPGLARGGSGLPSLEVVGDVLAGAGWGITLAQSGA
jgi:hypothetical protein